MRDARAAQAIGLPTASRLYGPGGSGAAFRLPDLPDRVRLELDTDLPDPRDEVFELPPIAPGRRRAFACPGPERDEPVPVLGVLEQVGLAAAGHVRGRPCREGLPGVP